MLIVHRSVVLDTRPVLFVNKRRRYWRTDYRLQNVPNKKPSCRRIANRIDVKTLEIFLKTLKKRGENIKNV